MTHQFLGSQSINPNINNNNNTKDDPTAVPPIFGILEKHWWDGNAFAVVPENHVSVSRKRRRSSVAASNNNNNNEPGTLSQENSLTKSTSEGNDYQSLRRTSSTRGPLNQQDASAAAMVAVVVPMVNKSFWEQQQKLKQKRLQAQQEQERQKQLEKEASSPWTPFRPVSTSGSVNPLVSQENATGGGGRRPSDSFNSPFGKSTTSEGDVPVSTNIFLSSTNQTPENNVTKSLSGENNSNNIHTENQNQNNMLSPPALSMYAAQKRRRSRAMSLAVAAANGDKQASGTLAQLISKKKAPPSLVCPQFFINKMDFLPRSALRLQNLAILDLSNSRLTDLGPGATWRFMAKTLKVLYLHDNRITRYTFVESVLSELHNLQHLTLAGNFIEPPRSTFGSAATTTSSSNAASGGGYASLRQTIAQSFLQLLVLDEHFILDVERLDFVYMDNLMEKKKKKQELKEQIAKSSLRRRKSLFEEFDKSMNAAASRNEKTIENTRNFYVPFSPHSYIGCERTSYQLRRQQIEDRKRLVESLLQEKRARQSKLVPQQQQRHSLSTSGKLGLSTSSSNASPDFDRSNTKNSNRTDAGGGGENDEAFLSPTAAITPNTTFESLISWEWKHLRFLPIRAAALSPAVMIQKNWRRFYCVRKYQEMKQALLNERNAKFGRRPSSAASPALSLSRTKSGRLQMLEREDEEQVNEEELSEEEKKERLQKIQEKKIKTQKAIDVLTRVIFTYVRSRRGLKKMIMRKIAASARQQQQKSIQLCSSATSPSTSSASSITAQPRYRLFVDQLQMYRWERWVDEMNTLEIEEKHSDEKSDDEIPQEVGDSMNLDFFTKKVVRHAKMIIGTEGAESLKKKYLQYEKLIEDFKKRELPPQQHQQQQQQRLSGNSSFASYDQYTEEKKRRSIVSMFSNATNDSSGLEATSNEPQQQQRTGNKKTPSPEAVFNNNASIVSSSSTTWNNNNTFSFMNSTMTANNNSLVPFLLQKILDDEMKQSHGMNLANNTNNHSPSPKSPTTIKNIGLKFNKKRKNQIFSLVEPWYSSWPSWHTPSSDKRDFSSWQLMRSVVTASYNPRKFLYRESKLSSYYKQATATAGSSPLLSDATSPLLMSPLDDDGPFGSGDRKVVSWEYDDDSDDDSNNSTGFSDDDDSEEEGSFKLDDNASGENDEAGNSNLASNFQDSLQFGFTNNNQQTSGGFSRSNSDNTTTNKKQQKKRKNATNQRQKFTHDQMQELVAQSAHIDKKQMRVVHQSRYATTMSFTHAHLPTTREEADSFRRAQATAASSRITGDVHHQQGGTKNKSKKKNISTATNNSTKRRDSSIFSGMAISESRRKSLAEMMSSSTRVGAPLQSSVSAYQTYDSASPVLRNIRSSFSAEKLDEFDRTRPKQFVSKLLRVKQRTFTPIPLQAIEFDSAENMTKFLMRLHSLNRLRPRAQIHYFFEDDLERLRAATVLQAWWRGMWTRLRFQSWQMLTVVEEHKIMLDTRRKFLIGQRNQHKMMIKLQKNASDGAGGKKNKTSFNDDNAEDEDDDDDDDLYAADLQAKLPTSVDDVLVTTFPVTRNIWNYKVARELKVGPSIVLFSCIQIQNWWRCVLSKRRFKYLKTLHTVIENHIQKSSSRMYLSSKTLLALLKDIHSVFFGKQLQQQQHHQTMMMADGSISNSNNASLYPFQNTSSTTPIFSFAASPAFMSPHASCLSAGAPNQQYQQMTPTAVSGNKSFTSINTAVGGAPNASFSNFSMVNPPSFTVTSSTNNQQQQQERGTPSSSDHHDTNNTTMMMRANAPTSSFHASSSVIVAPKPQNKNPFTVTVEPCSPLEPEPKNKNENGDDQESSTNETPIVSVLTAGNRHRTATMPPALPQQDQEQQSEAGNQQQQPTSTTTNWLSAEAGAFTQFSSATGNRSLSPSGGGGSGWNSDMNNLSFGGASTASVALTASPQSFNDDEEEENNRGGRPQINFKNNNRSTNKSFATTTGSGSIHLGSTKAVRAELARLQLQFEEHESVRACLKRIAKTIYDRRKEANCSGNSAQKDDGEATSYNNPLVCLCARLLPELASVHKDALSSLATALKNAAIKSQDAAEQTKEEQTHLIQKATAYAIGDASSSSATMNSSVRKHETAEQRRKTRRANAKKRHQQEQQQQQQQSLRQQQQHQNGSDSASNSASPGSASGLTMINSSTTLMMMSQPTSAKLPITRRFTPSSTTGVIPNFSFSDGCGDTSSGTTSNNPTVNRQQSQESGSIDHAGVAATNSTSTMMTMASGQHHHHQGSGLGQNVQFTLSSQFDENGNVRRSTSHDNNKNNDSASDDDEDDEEDKSNNLTKKKNHDNTAIDQLRLPMVIRCKYTSPSSYFSCLFDDQNISSLGCINKENLARLLTRIELEIMICQARENSTSYVATQKHAERSLLSSLYRRESSSLYAHHQHQHQHQFPYSNINPALTVGTAISRRGSSAEPTSSTNNNLFASSLPVQQQQQQQQQQRDQQQQQHDNIIPPVALVARRRSSVVVDESKNEEFSPQSSTNPIVAGSHSFSALSFQQKRPPPLIATEGSFDPATPSDSDIAGAGGRAGSNTNTTNDDDGEKSGDGGSLSSTTRLMNNMMMNNSKPTMSNSFSSSNNNTSKQQQQNTIPHCPPSSWLLKFAAAASLLHGCELTQFFTGEFDILGPVARKVSPDDDQSLEGRYHHRKQQQQKSSNNTSNSNAASNDVSPRRGGRQQQQQHEFLNASFNLNISAATPTRGRSLSTSGFAGDFNQSTTRSRRSSMSASASPSASPRARTTSMSRARTPLLSPSSNTAASSPSSTTFLNHTTSNKRRRSPTAATAQTEEEIKRERAIKKVVQALGRVFKGIRNKQKSKEEIARERNVRMFDQNEDPDQKCPLAVGPSEGNLLERIDWLVKLCEQHPNGYLVVSSATAGEALSRFLLVASLTWQLPDGEMLCPEPLERLRVRSAVLTIEKWRLKILAAREEAERKRQLKEEQERPKSPTRIKKNVTVIYRSNDDNDNKTHEETKPMLKVSSIDGLDVPDQSTKRKGSSMFVAHRPTSGKQSLASTRRPSLSQQQQQQRPASSIPSLRPESSDLHHNLMASSTTSEYVIHSNTNNNSNEEETEFSSIQKNHQKNKKDSFISMAKLSSRQMNAPFITRNIASSTMSKRPTAVMEEQRTVLSACSSVKASPSCTSLLSSSLNSGHNMMPLPPPSLAHSLSSRPTSARRSPLGEKKDTTMTLAYRDDEDHHHEKEEDEHENEQRNDTFSKSSLILSGGETIFTQKSFKAGVKKPSWNHRTAPQRPFSASMKARAEHEELLQRMKKQQEEEEEKGEEKETTTHTEQQREEAKIAKTRIDSDDDDDDEGEVVPFEPEKDEITFSAEDEKKRKIHHHHHHKTTSSERRKSTSVSKEEQEQQPDLPSLKNEDEDFDEIGVEEDEQEKQPEQQNDESEQQEQEQEVEPEEKQQSNNHEEEKDKQEEPHINNKLHDLGIRSKNSTLRTIYAERDHQRALDTRVNTEKITTKTATIPRPPSARRPQYLHHYQQSTSATKHQGENDENTFNLINQITMQFPSASSAKNADDIIYQENRLQDNFGVSSSSSRSAATPLLQSSVNFVRPSSAAAAAARHVEGVHHQPALEERKQKEQQHHLIFMDRRKRPESARVVSSSLVSSKNKNTNTHHQMKQDDLAIITTSSARQKERQQKNVHLASSSSSLNTNKEILDQPNAAHAFHVACLKEYANAKKRSDEKRENETEKKLKFMQQQTQEEERMKKERYLQSRAASRDRIARTPYPLGRATPLVPFSKLVPSAAVKKNTRPSSSSARK